MRKNNYIRIRLTDREKEQLQLLATDSSKTVSAYIRDIVYKLYLKERGGNIDNQLRQKAN